MIQQIDLYQDCFKAGQDPLPPRTIGLLLGVGLLALMLIFGIGKGKINSLDARFHELQNRKIEMLEALTQARERSDQSMVSSLLQKELARAESEVNLKGSLLSKIKKLKQKNSLRFSEYLESLGQIDHKGLWLTRIEVREEGARVTMAGSALHPQQVSQFTENLARDEKYSGIKTAKLWIQSSATGRDHVNFILESDPERTP